MKDIDTILFDLDGTLVDSRKDITDAANYALRNLGFEERSIDEIISYVGHGMGNFIRKIMTGIGEEMTEKALELYTSYFSEHYADKSILYANVREVLDSLKGKDMKIVTNRKSAFVSGTLEKLGIESFFSAVKGGDHDTWLKPSPFMIHDALEGSSWDRDLVLMVGDMDVDILAGKAAGVLTCGVTYGYSSRDQLEKHDPDLLVDDISELGNWIK